MVPFGDSDSQTLSGISVLPAPGDETPRRFTRGDQLGEILAVVDQWRTPDHRDFRVRTADETYTLRHDVRSGGWEVTELGRRGPR